MAIDATAEDIQRAITSMLEQIGREYMYNRFDEDRWMDPQVLYISLTPCGEPVFLDIETQSILNRYKKSEDIQ